MSDNSFYVVWEITCNKPPNNGEPRMFIVVDDGGDPDFQCSVCGASGNHLPMVTDVAESECWRCKGKGTRKSYDNSEVQCPSCEGTGIHKNTHTRKLVGRAYEKDIIKLAKKDPQGWR
jgi:hypothetical protein